MCKEIVRIYYCNNYVGNKEKTVSRNLLVRSLEEYRCDEKITDDRIELVFKKNKNGKPYVENADIQFNLSHSENFWCCAVSKNVIGIDVQKICKCEYKKLSDRFFTSMEKAYVDEKGQEGFFSIWAYKEAWAKAEGESVFQVISKRNTVENNTMIKRSGELTFNEINIDNSVKCVVAVKTEDPKYIVKMLNTRKE